MLTQAWSDAADLALAKLETAVSALDASAAHSGDLVNEAWTWIVGDQSTQEGIVENARQADKLLGIMRAKRPILASDDEAAAFVRSCGQYADVGDALAIAQSTTAAGGVTEIAQATAGELVDDVKKAAGIGAVGLALVAGVLVLFILAKRG